MKLIIHSGYPKCASSHLQSLLELKEKDGGLAALGYRYPLDTVEAIGTRNGHLLIDYFNSGTESSLQALAQQITSAPMNCIYSDECGVSVLALDKMVRLEDTIPSYIEITIVTAIREPSEWFLSDYYQHIKTQVHNLPFCEHVFLRETQEVMDYVKYFSRFRLGTINIVACDHGNLIRCIESVMGAPIGFLETSDYVAINSNKSPNANTIEAMRVSALLGMAGDFKTQNILEATMTQCSLELGRKEFMAYLKLKYCNYRNSIKELDYVEFYENR